MTNAHGVARDQLRAFVERIERLEEEKKTIADDIKDVYGEAKTMGFDTKVLKKLIGLRKKDEQERQEEELILDTYMAALGMIPQLDMFEDDAPKAKSPAMALQSPRKAAEAVSERTVTNQPETATKLSRPASYAVSGGEPSKPTSHDGGAKMDSPHGHPGRSDDTSEHKDAEWEEAATSNSPIDPASHGEAEAKSPETEEGDSNEVAHVHSHAATAGTRINHIVPATPPKTARDFRPHCLKPDACGASGLSHCYNCTKAMKKAEEFA